MSRGLLRLIALAASLPLVACGGGGGGSHAAPAIPVATPTAASAPAKTATARLTLTIPAKGIRARGRTPKYISPSTASAVVTVNSGSPQSYSLSPTGPNCSTSGTTTACILNVAAPIGASDQFQITLEDGDAFPLSAGQFSVAIAEGVSNVTVPLVLGGIPSTLDITSAATGGETFFTIDGGLQTAPLIATVKDADQNIIIGNEPFVDTNGAPDPIVVTSSNGSTLKYAVAPAGGSFGSASTSVSFAAPSDTLEVVYSGTGIPPGYDTFSYSPATVTSLTYGNSPKLGIGLTWQAPFTPTSIAPLSADVASAAGVGQGAIITDGYSRVAVVGAGSCQISTPIIPTTIWSIAIDAGATPYDGAVYLIAGSSTVYETDLSNFSISSIAGGSCPSANSYVTYSNELSASGIVRATGGNIVYFLANPSNTGFYPPYLETATSSNPTTVTGGAILNNPVGGLALDGTHVYVCSEYNGTANIEIQEFDLPISSTPTHSSYSSASNGVSPLCSGIAVDPVSHISAVTDDTGTSATRWTTNPISAEQIITLSNPASPGASMPDAQGAAAGNWHGSEAFFFLTSGGIEVWNQSAPYMQQTILTLAGTGLSSAVTSGSIQAISYGADDRLWVTLSSGYVLAIPTF